MAGGTGLTFTISYYYTFEAWPIHLREVQHIKVETYTRCVYTRVCVCGCANLNNADTPIFITMSITRWKKAWIDRM